LSVQSINCGFPVRWATSVSLWKVPRRLRHALVLAVLITLMVLKGGCVTRLGIAEIDPAILFQNADCLLIVPVQANRALVDLIASGSSGTAETSQLFDRTRRVILALYADQTEPSGWQARFFASGEYPATFARFAFPASKGWERHSKKGLPVWYESDRLAVSLPRREQAFVVSGQRAGEGVQELLQKNLSRKQSGINPLPDRLRQHQFFGDEILIWTDKPEILTSSIIGPLIRLPLDSAELILVPSDGQYLLCARLELSDARTVRVVRSMLVLAFGIEFKSEGRILFIENVPVSTAVLAETLSRFIYF